MGRIAAVLGIKFDWSTGAVSPPEDLTTAAIVRVANEPRTRRRGADSLSVEQRLAEVVKLARSLDLAPSDVVEHFRRLQGGLDQAARDIEELLEGDVGDAGRDGDGNTAPKAKPQKRNSPPMKAG